MDNIIRSGVNFKIYFYCYCKYLLLFLFTLLVSTPQFGHGYTNADDVNAMNMLYAALGYPLITGWIPNGGDPCTEHWQGVTCNATDVISIVLNGVNLGGHLGDYLGSFASIQTLDLSSNQIGGRIPPNLPPTVQNFILASNLLNGSIPGTISTLSQLKALDFSSNNLTGELPPSMETLLSLTTLHLQNNQLSGTLDVLQDLPLSDLNIENNLFSGVIPEKMLSIPVFSKDGNLFNTSISPLASPPSPLIPPSPLTPPSTYTPTTAPPFFKPPTTSDKTPGKQANGPSSLKESEGKKSFLNTKRIIWISIAAVLLLVVLALAFLLLLPRLCRKRQVADRYTERHETSGYKPRRESTVHDNRYMLPPTKQLEKVPKQPAINLKENHKTLNPPLGPIIKPSNEHDWNGKRINPISRQESSIDMTFLPPPPPPPPPPPLPIAKVIVEPTIASESIGVNPSTSTSNISTSVKSFTIASLQQYTNSFSQDNLIGGGMLGSVYRAELPNGKLLAVKKLDRRVASHQKEDQFIELVNNIDRIRHANVVELMGYCAEHGQRLLVYEYCSSGTLQDALHSDEGLKKKLSWNSRIRMALEAARALEYLHEICVPPVVHRNFKAANVLLDDELAVRISDCGMAPLIQLGSVSQLSGQLLSAYGYGAPEFESGIYTIRSDVYSFGVVMLELLTGRKSHDSKRARGEQFLVRWAIPRLHDIDALSRMVDPSLNGAYPPKSLSHFADIISRCVQNEPEFRPPMSEVVQDLLDMIRKEPHRHRSNSD